jgi:hypothetical protein
VRGAESSNPILRRSDAPDATVGGAGFNMEKFRDMIKQIISEEKEKDRASAPMRFQADPMLEARNQTRQMIAEEMARERQRQAQFGANMPTTSGGEVHGHGEGGTSKGPTMQAGTNFGLTASVGNSKFNVAMPPKFNPDEHSWMLWRPQVVSYFEMIGLEGILDEKTGDDFSLQVNRYAIGTLQQISPSQDAAWMSTLRLRYAYEAWDQLQKAYGSRAELDMQKKLFEFESAAQRENESVREWAIRLERQVTELNVMAKEAAKEDVMGYNEHRDTAVYESIHKFRLLNVRIDDQSYESFIAALRCQIFNMDVKEVETALITYEQGRDVQRALNSAAGSVSAMSAGMGGRKFFCYACNGEGHHWKTCLATNTPEGVAGLRSKNIHVPTNIRPTSIGPTRHDPNRGRGYGGRSYFAGRGRGEGGRGRYGAGRGRGVPPGRKQVRFDRDREVNPDNGMDLK